MLRNRMDRTNSKLRFRPGRETRLIHLAHIAEEKEYKKRMAGLEKMGKLFYWRECSLLRVLYPDMRAPMPKNPFKKESDGMLTKPNAKVLYSKLATAPAGWFHTREGSRLLKHVLETEGKEEADILRNLLDLCAAMDKVHG